MIHEDNIFGALANPTRRQLLALLARGPMNAGSLAAHFKLSRPAISEHMRVLANAGFVAEQTLGRERIYALNKDPFQAVGNWLQPFETYWTTKLVDLAVLLEEKDHDN